MSAIIVDICNAVVTKLEGATFNQEFTVSRGWLELVQRQKMHDTDPISVLVVPGMLGVYAFDLTPRVAFDWEVGLWIDKSIEANVATIDPVAEFVEQVTQLFAANRILNAGSRKAKCIQIEADPVYDEKQLSELRIFRALIKITYRVTQ